MIYVKEFARALDLNSCRTASRQHEEEERRGCERGSGHLPDCAAALSICLSRLRSALRPNSRRPAIDENGATCLYRRKREKY